MFERTLRRARALRLHHRILLGAVVAVLAYLILLHLFLNLALARLISRNPDALRIRWRFAWSLVPGYAHVHGFELRAQAPDVQWELRIDEADTRVALTSLLERRFETRWVEARGVVFRLRPRLPSDDDLAESSAPYPPIGGFSDPPRRAFEVPRGIDPLGRSWSVRLEGVTATVREAWIAAHRGVGRAEARGRLDFHPDRHLRVGPATLVIAEARTWLGQAPVADTLSAKVQCQFAIEDMAQLSGLRVLRAIAARVELRGTLHSMAFLGYHLRDLSGPEISGGPAELAVRGGLDHGRLIEGTSLTMEGRDASASLPGHLIHGPWTLRATAEGSAPQRDRLVLEVRPLQVEGREGRLIDAAQLRAELGGKDLLLGEIPDDGFVRLQLSNADAPFRLQRLNGDLGGLPFAITAGEARLKLALKAGAGVSQPRGAFWLSVERAEVRWGENNLRGDLILDVDLVRLKLARREIDLAGTDLTLARVALAGDDGKTRGWNGHVHLKDAQLRLAPHLALHADIVGRFSNAEPFLLLFREKAGLPRWSLPLLQARDLSFDSSLDLSEETLEVRRLSAQGQGFELQGRLTRSRQALNALLLARVRGFSVGVEAADGKVDLKLAKPEPWFAERLRDGEKHQ